MDNGSCISFDFHKKFFNNFVLKSHMLELKSSLIDCMKRLRRPDGVIGLLLIYVHEYICSLSHSLSHSLSQSFSYIKM